MTTIIIFVLFVLLFISLLVWATLTARKQVLKDWDTLRQLQENANKLETKKEIEDFHKEFIEKATKIYNPQIALELNKIDGYVRGLYKQFKQ